MSAGVRNRVYSSQDGHVIRLDFRINLSSLPLSCHVFRHVICLLRRCLMFTVKTPPHWCRMSRCSTERFISPVSQCERNPGAVSGNNTVASTIN